MGWTPGIETWPKIDRDYNPNQKEIEFFWPLTEQIELDLDFSNCDTKKSFAIPVDIGTGNTIIQYAASNQTWSTSINSDKIETNEITFTLNKKPFIIKRLVYKMLGFKWKVR